MTVAALLLAGGRGTRAGGGIPKQYRKIGGISVLRHAINCFVDCTAVELIRVVIHADDQELYRSAVAGLDILPPVIGGTERHLSAVNGLESLSDLGTDIVLIHDAARPFADRGVIKRVIAALANADGAIPALPVSDTLKRVASTDVLIEETVDRAGLWRAQTPQGFRFKAILEAHRQRDSDLPTDDAAVMEESGMLVRIVDGDEQNIKLTTEADLSRARQMLGKYQMQTRVGTGFDVHKLGPGDGVTLCGIMVPCDMSLIGHSDADVALHALTDALLGAIGCGDIGLHFPPSDPQWKGAASHIFVEAAAADIRKAGGSIVNVDVTIIGEHPKVGPYREEMRAKVAEFLEIPLDRVNIKATTTERLGFTGRGEGLAAQAIASVEVAAT
jgi:2-C-methyl-D-erythritol 4-phosphate cytidylyltransferase/2-C-methyl-D-erythritol 2,4-cyclodiphosphate synthase